MSDLSGGTRLEPRDIGLLSLFCGLLFGAGLVCGGELSWSEAIVPQTARTMLEGGDWLVPKRGGGPWLEGAPLAQWLMASVWSLFGGERHVWLARLPSVFCAFATVLITAHLGATWFGRTAGVLSGLILATTSQFAGQSWRANDVTLLTFLVTVSLALFTRVELARDGETARLGRGLWPKLLGARPVRVLLLFALLGATNLTGPLWLGPACVAVPIVGFLLWNWDALRVERYVWLWGWLLAAVIGAAWPLSIAAQFPDAWDFWSFDLSMRLMGEDAGFSAAVAKPMWFYAAILPWMLAPWSVVVPAGIWMVRHEALAERYSPQRFLWCWAGLWPLVISLISGKHPHYLLPSLPAWSLLAGLGLLWLRNRIREWPEWACRPWPLGAILVLPLAVWLRLSHAAIGGWHGAPLWLSLCPLVAAICVWSLRRDDFSRAARTIFASLALLHVVGFWESGTRREPQLRADAAFLKHVRSAVPDSAALVLDMSIGGAKGSWCQFLLGERATPVHNLTFLPEATEPDRDAYVVTDGTNRVLLDRFGSVMLMLNSSSANEPSLMLYRLAWRADSPRLTSRTREISPMQSKFQSLGPYLEPRLRIGASSAEKW